MFSTPICTTQTLKPGAFVVPHRHPKSQGGASSKSFASFFSRATLDLNRNTNVLLSLRLAHFDSQGCNKTSSTLHSLDSFLVKLCQNEAPFWNLEFTVLSLIEDNFLGVCTSTYYRFYRIIHTISACHVVRRPEFRPLSSCSFCVWNRTLQGWNLFSWVAGRLYQVPPSDHDFWDPCNIRVEACNHHYFEGWPGVGP